MKPKKTNQLTREEVIMGVLWGDLDESNLTEGEIEALALRVNDIVTDRILSQAAQDGKAVFSDRDTGLLN